MLYYNRNGNYNNMEMEIEIIIIWKHFHTYGKLAAVVEVILSMTE